MESSLRAKGHGEQQKQSKNKSHGLFGEKQLSDIATETFLQGRTREQLKRLSTRADYELWKLQKNTIFAMFVIPLFEIELINFQPFVWLINATSVLPPQRAMSP